MIGMMKNIPYEPARKGCGMSRHIRRQKVRLNVYATTPKRTLYVNRNMVIYYLRALP